MSRKPTHKPIIVKAAGCRELQLEKSCEFLKSLTQKRFFGRIEITMRDGYIEIIEKRECLKPENL